MYVLLILPHYTKPCKMSKIRVLDAEVVKRIAAGETLQRPVNAVKELIENSLDAGATRISINVSVPTSSSSTETSAGLFSIQVTDNGVGIAKEDLELLCERHATSKLTSIGDLGTMSTFGFRGEALASCSQVARVDVITRHRGEMEGEVAWKASYIAGKLSNEPVPVAGNFGTIINVKDLFYGNRVRREALLNSSEEYQKIVQVIQAYTLNQAGRCAFMLSKRRDRIDLQSSLTDSVEQVVNNLWNNEIGGALLPFRIDSDSKLGIEDGSGGWGTRTTFHKLKSPQVIIFLNNRLIEHPTLRRAILQAFALHLPTSPPAHPFLYLNLKLKANRVDVNVHPSKRQVFFLDEEDIVRRVVDGIDLHILQRQYETQTLNPIVINKDDFGGEELNKKQKPPIKQSQSILGNNNNTPPSNTQSSVQKPGISKISSLYPNQRILTDHRNHRIDSFLFHSQTLPAKSEPENSFDESNLSFKWNKLKRKENFSDQYDLSNISNTSIMSDSCCSESVEHCKAGNILDSSVEHTKAELGNILDSSVECNSLESSAEMFSFCNTSAEFIKSAESTKIPTETTPNQSCTTTTSLKLSEFLKLKSNDQLNRLLQSSIVVGLVDSKWCLLQSGTNLLLCDMDRLNFDLFFSILGEGKFIGEFEVKIGVMGLFESEEIGIEAVEVIRRNSKFFSDKFGIKFEAQDDSTDSIDMELKSIPTLLPGQRCPSRKFLETFIQRLCLMMKHEELPILTELALLYSLIDTEEWLDWEDYVKFVILNGYRDTSAKFTLKNDFKLESSESDGNLPPPLRIITNTETLYKSFERC